MIQNQAFSVRHFLRQLPRQNVPKHDKIRRQTHRRIDERSGFIFFKKEMSRPRKAVAQNWTKPQKRPICRENCVKKGRDKERSADKMQAAARCVLVFRQIVRIKIFEIGVRLCH